MQSTGKSFNSTPHFQCGFFDEWHNYKRVRNSQTSAAVSSPADTQRPPPLSAADCPMLFAPYLFFLLLFLLASALPVAHTLAFQRRSYTLAKFRCYYLSSDYKVSKCSISKKRHSPGIHLVTYHLLTHACCTSILSQPRPLFSYIIIHWLKEKNEVSAGAGEFLKIEKGGYVI